MVSPETGSAAGNGRKMIKKTQNAIARMLQIRPNLPRFQGPNVIGFDLSNRRMAKRTMGMQ